MAINISSGTPLYFISANTDGNVSKLQDEVLIFSIIRAVGSFARTIVMMSEFFRVITPSCANANETQQRERVRARRTDNRDLRIGGFLSDHTLGLQFCAHSSFEGLEVEPYSTDCRVKWDT